MSNLILNDNIIGGSSNDSSDILYTPNDNRAETNVQDELDKINTELSKKEKTEIITTSQSSSIVIDPKYTKIGVAVSATQTGQIMNPAFLDVDLFKTRCTTGATGLASSYESSNILRVARLHYDTNASKIVIATGSNNEWAIVMGVYLG